jgi:hypothetical protein
MFSKSFDLLLWEEKIADRVDHPSRRIGRDRVRRYLTYQKDAVRNSTLSTCCDYGEGITSCLQTQQHQIIPIKLNICEFALISASLKLLVNMKIGNRGILQSCVDSTRLWLMMDRIADHLGVIVCHPSAPTYNSHMVLDQHYPRFLVIANFLGASTRTRMLTGYTF